jgi:uncharacterized oxidoreductase
MKTTKNTVLITGGGSGIGFETAKLLSKKGNDVIIVGRNETKLSSAAAQLENVSTFTCDITRKEDVDALVQHVIKNFASLNILMNNAGKAHAYALSEHANAFEKAEEEMLTNYLATVRLTEKFLPLLKSKSEAGIINVTSVVAFAPAAMLSTYSATKAALHSYSQTLRLSLKSTNVKVFELMPPLVDTEFSRTIPGDKIHPSVVVEDLLTALQNDHFEIHVGNTALVYKKFLASPAEALMALNRVEIV